MGVCVEDEWAPSVPRCGLVIPFVSPETTVAAAKLRPCSYQSETAEINLSSVSDSAVTLCSFFAAPLGVPRQADVHLLVATKLETFHVLWLQGSSTLVQKVALLMTLSQSTGHLKHLHLLKNICFNSLE